MAKRPVAEDILTNTTTTMNDLEEMKLELPWLSSILNANGSISIFQGTFDLGLNATVSDQPECAVSSENYMGMCTLINKCPQIYPILKDEKIFATYFCDLNGYAGVCCSKTDDSAT